VKAAAHALSDGGCHVEEVRLPVLEQTDANSALWQLQQMESRPEFEKVIAGHEAQIFRHAKLILDTPDAPIADFVAAEQAVERPATASSTISGVTMRCSVRRPRSRRPSADSMTSWWMARRYQPST
jgi:hypothetical protein